MIRPALIFATLPLGLGAAAPAVPTSSALPDPHAVVATMERVADWQLAHPPQGDTEDNPAEHRMATYSPRGWVRAAGYTGLMALGEISPRYRDAMRAMGERNQWQPGVRPYHADDACVIQTYADLYLRDRRPEIIAPSVERFDFILAHPATGSLAFTGPHRDERWSWCDALFMAPPAWLKLARATGKRAYAEFAITQWWQTSNYLYDPTEHLYFRDSTYFDRREANGKKVFWARGNGWVLGGLVRVLQLLAPEDPARPRFERQFREMAAKLVTLQQPDGFWRASLLDPEHYPAQEESGTGFFCYGLAWGLNEGLLDRDTYLEPTLRAWHALETCVQPDGRLIHVQPIGADPRHFDPNSTEPYGVGAFLLAGSEVRRLAATRGRSKP